MLWPSNTKFLASIEQVGRPYAQNQLLLQYGSEFTSSYDSGKVIQMAPS